MRIDTHHHHKKASDNLAFVFLLNLTFNIIVIIGGLATNSMAILADCIHDMSDTFSILGAVITSTFVIVMAFFILSEAIPRLFSPEGVDAEGMLIIGIIGLVFKTISVWRLHGGETFNEKAIFYHLLGDIFEWVAILILSVILTDRKGVVQIKID